MSADRPAADRPPAAGLRYAWMVATLLGAANLISFLDRGILNLLVEPMKRDLALTDTEISLLQGMAFILFYSVVALPIGRMADRTSRVRIIMAGTLLWSMATAACGAARGYGHLFLARMGVGLGEATLPPAAVSVISDLFPRQMLGRAIAVFTGVGTIGGSLSYILGGILYRHFAARGDLVLPLLGTVRPWQMCFIAVSLPGVLIGLAMLLVREPARRMVAGAREPRASVGDLLRFLWDQRRAVVCVMVGYSCVACAQSALGAWMPAFFMRTFGSGPAEIGPKLGAVQLACGLGGVFTGGVLADVLRRRGAEDANLRVALIAIAVAIPCGIAATLMADPDLCLALWFPTNFAMMVCFGTATPAFPLVTPGALRAQVLALYLLLGNLLGAGLGPTMVAVITQYGFGDPLALRYGMSITAAALYPAAFILLAVGRPAFVGQIRRLQAETEPLPPAGGRQP